jgi:hypothetical protein
LPPSLFKKQINCWILQLATLYAPKPGEESRINGHYRDTIYLMRKAIVGCCEGGANPQLAEMKQFPRLSPVAM